MDRRPVGLYTERRMNRTWSTLFLLLAAVLGLAACAGPSSQGAAQAAPPTDLASWDGISAEDVQQRLGPPDETAKLASGDTVMTYRYSRVQMVGGYTTAGGSLYTGSSVAMGRVYQPMQQVNLTCLTRFTVGPDDKVKAIEQQGNACYGISK